MKFSQNTKFVMKQKYITLILLKEKKKLHFGCSVSFDHKQHKCYSQMNNTRGLILYFTYKNDQRA